MRTRFAFLLLVPCGLSAQPVVPAKAGLLSFLEGKVYLDDHAVEISPAHFPQVNGNSVLRTETGRAEVLLGPCAVLRMDENSSFRMLANGLVDTELELLAGRAVVDVSGIARNGKLTLVTKPGAVQFQKAGLYRIETEPPRVKVFAGGAMVQWGDRSVAVAAGRMLALDAVAPEKFDARTRDALDLWSTTRAAVLAAAAGGNRQQQRQAAELASAASAAASVEGPVHDHYTDTYVVKSGPPSGTRPTVVTPSGCGAQ